MALLTTTIHHALATGGESLAVCFSDPGCLIGRVALLCLKLPYRHIRQLTWHNLSVHPGHILIVGIQVPVLAQIASHTLRMTWLPALHAGLTQVVDQVLDVAASSLLHGILVITRFELLLL